MLNYVLLATSVAIATPALAQNTPAGTTTVAPQTVPAPQPVPDAQVPAPAPAAPDAQTAATPAQPAPVQTATAPAQPAPATTPDQVALAVGAGWPTYDKDGNGTLDKAEFGAWLIALRTASEPSFDAQTPAATTWVGQAFGIADADKSKTVTNAEMTTFLTPKPS